MFKINIGTKEGKTFKLETEVPELIGKSLHEKIEGKEISSDLDGYEFEIAGASDSSGFTSMENIDGIDLKKVLLTYGKGMHKKPKGLKKKNKKPKGLRLRKTVRGRIISPAVVQINLKTLKEGTKKLSEIFPEQNKPKEKAEEKKEVEEKKASVVEAGKELEKAAAKQMKHLVGGKHKEPKIKRVALKK